MRCYSVVDLIPIGDGIPTLELESECEDCDSPSVLGSADEFTATLDCDMSDLWYRLLPRGMVNARILKRDGFLSPNNGVLK